MSPLEILMAEYENELIFKFETMPDKLHGLIDDNVVYLNKNSSEREQYSALAEELGHYETSVEDDISDYSKLLNRKMEIKARRWSYERLIPIEDLKEILSSNNHITFFELSEIFHVPQNIIEKAIEYYKIKELL